MIPRIWILSVLCIAALVIRANGQNCTEDRARRCISIAEPMLKNPHLIFPDNAEDINIVCRTWSNFESCIRHYIDQCFSRERKDRFNLAVELPITSVHQICTIPAYKTEYLEYAACYKAAVVETEHCGHHYTFLVEQVSQENVRKADLCCAYHNFRSCVIQTTQSKCDSKQMGGLAARFSRQVLDRAFRFLQEECINHMSDSGKCSMMMMMENASSPMPMIPMDRPSESRRSSSDEPRRTVPHSLLFEDKTKPGDEYEIVTKNSQHHDSGRTSTMKNVEESQPHSSIDLRMPVTTSAYNSNFHLKSGRVKGDTPERGQNRKPETPRYTSIVDNSVSMASVTQRSPSYGRGIVWTSSPPTTSSVPDWATSFWYSYTQDTNTEEIYPAPGSFGGNNIDEPNQQGLSRSAQIKSSQPILRSIIVLFALSGILI